MRDARFRRMGFRRRHGRCRILLEKRVDPRVIDLLADLQIVVRPHLVTDANGGIAQAIEIDALAPPSALVSMS